MDSRVPEKKERLLAALEAGMVMIHLDARRPGVRVPESLKGEAHLRLNLSYRFDPPDLSVGDWGVRCTLSFSGSRFQVAVPWSALFAIACHQTRENWVFPEDMPEELLHQAPAPQAGDGAPGPRPVALRPAPAAAPAPGPTAVPAPAPAAVPAPAVSAAEGTPRPALREVPREPPAAPAAAASPPPDGEEGPREPPPAPAGPGRGHLRLVK
jgi:stringent starvation protein B